MRYPKEMPWWINQYYYHFDNIEQWYNYQCNIISRTDIIRLIYFSDVVAKTYFTFLVVGSTIMIVTYMDPDFIKLCTTSRLVKQNGKCHFYLAGKWSVLVLVSIIVVTI